MISIILTTYNRPKALIKVLDSLLNQQNTFKDKYEILIADDGSDQDTKDIINQYQQQSKITIKHIWQENQGFRAGTIRNKAAQQAQGDYLIFIDGDCIVSKHFLHYHQKLAQTGYLVSGNRVLLSQAFTDQIENDKNFNLNQKSFLNLILYRLTKKINRLIPCLYLSIYPRKRYETRWQGAKTCNLALWKQDFLKVHGFDESYQGWGYEDSDLVIRLFKIGIKRIDGRFATYVFHLWHKENDRQHQQQNWERFVNRLNQTKLR